MIAASDYVRALPLLIANDLQSPYTVLGTDGFGRSDFRGRLRTHFEVNRYYVVIAALKSLADDGAIPAKTVADAIKKYGIDTEKVNPLYA